MAKNNKKQAEEAIGLDVELRKSEAFIEKNLKKILIVLAAIVVVAVGFFLYQNHQEAQEKEAQAAISKCETLFYQQQYEVALNGDGITKGFLSIISNYSGTKTANLATLFAGICQYNLGQYDEAINYLEDFTPQDDQTISASALAALGNSYAQKGDNVKAAETLLKAAKYADNNLSAIFMQQAATLYESLNQPEKALEIYKQIKAEYSTSPLIQNVEKNIEKLTK